MSFSLSKTIENLDTFVIRDLPLNRVSSIKRKTLITHYIEPLFRDWRDTLVNYYIYLPFADTVELEAYKIVDKTIQIDCLLDIRTGNMKYYILTGASASGGTIIKTVGGSCRVDFPVSATNPIQKAQEIRQGASAIFNWKANSVSNVTNTAINGSMGVLSAKNKKQVLSNTVNTARQLGNDIYGSIIDGINTLPQAVSDIHRPPSTSFGGSYSGGTNIDDPLDIYLYRVVPNIVYDEGLISNYGRPCNTWATIGSQRGYVKADDIRITGDIPQAHKVSLINDLSKGIYRI